MAVPLKHIEYDHERRTLIAIDMNGLLWHGQLTVSDDQRPVVDWSPMKGPPDGQQFTEGQKSFWDNMERKLRAIANASPNPDGTPVSVATKDELVAAGTGGEVEGTPDDSVEDGEGDDTSQ